MSDFRSKLRAKNAKASTKANIENIQDNGLGGLFVGGADEHDLSEVQNANESFSDALKTNSDAVKVESVKSDVEPLKNENNGVSDKFGQIGQEKNVEQVENVKKKESVEYVETVEPVENVNGEKQEIVQKRIKNTPKFENSGSLNQKKSTSSKFEEFVRKSNMFMEGKELLTEDKDNFVEKEDNEPKKEPKTVINKKETPKKEKISYKEPVKAAVQDGRKPLTDVKCSNEERMPTTSWNCMVDPELDIRFRYEVQVRETTIIELINRILLQEREWENEHPEFLTKEYVLENIRKSRNKKTEGRVALSLGLLPESWEYLKSSSKRRGMKMNAFIEFLLETYC